MLCHYAVSLFNKAILRSSLIENWEYLIMYIVSSWDEKLYHFYCVIDYYFPTAILFDLTNSKPINLFALLMFLIPKTVKSPSSPPASLINFNNWVLVGSWRSRNKKIVRYQEYFWTWWCINSAKWIYNSVVSAEIYSKKWHSTYISPDPSKSRHSLDILCLPLSPDLFHLWSKVVEEYFHQIF